MNLTVERSDEIMRYEDMFKNDKIHQNVS